VSIGNVISPFNTTGSLILTNAQNTLALKGFGNAALLQNVGNTAVNCYVSNTTSYVMNTATTNTNLQGTGVAVQPNANMLVSAPSSLDVLSSPTIYLTAMSCNSGGTLQATVVVGGTQFT
jgi:hypothetical protein